MSGILSIGASGLRAQQMRIDTIANNLANVDTVGFKESEPTVQDGLYEVVTLMAVDPEQNAIVGADFWLGQGAEVVATPRSQRQGAFVPTDNPLDLGILGDGFFAVRMPDGSTAYSRDGRFSLDGERHLVNASGLYLVDDIIVPENAEEIEVDASGNVTALDASTKRELQLGRVELARFSNPRGLEAVGDNLFRETVASGPAQLGQPGTGGYGQVISRALENSNVEISQQLTRMMEAQRAYQAAAKSIKTLDDMMQLANAVPR